MTVAASRVFEHIAQNRILRVTRHEVASAPFTRLRRAMYALILGLRDEESGDIDISDRLRQSLSEWLTVPVPFESLRALALDQLGDSALVELRWGEELRRSLDSARQSLRAVQRMESPLRAQLSRVIREANSGLCSWRIYCHRSAMEHFVSCAAGVDCTLGPDRFIHSLRDYRSSEPFDVLIKVGPLRTRGWGAIAGAFVNAPRYRHLVQVVWTGMGDEPGFGDDTLVTLLAGPSAARESAGDRNGTGLEAGTGASEGESPSTWSRSVIVHEDQSCTEDAPPPAIGETPPDELQTFARMRRIQAPRRALLLHVGDGLGLFYPPHADVLLLQPEMQSPDAAVRCSLADVDPRGRFLVRADIGEVNLGAHLTEHGWYSTRWKAELRRQFEWHPEGLLRRLRAAGIRLRRLRGCVEHWMQPASTVIHAPQQQRHFELLIEVLEMDTHAPQQGSERRRNSPWWRAAWQEIAVSRGQAIQFGMQEQEIISEEVDRIVLEILPEIHVQAERGEPFRVAIPPGKALEGSISFLPVREVEEGFRVPESALKSMVAISEAEEWRV